METKKPKQKHFLRGLAYPLLTAFCLCMGLVGLFIVVGLMSPSTTQARATPDNSYLQTYNAMLRVYQDAALVDEAQTGQELQAILDDLNKQDRVTPHKDLADDYLDMIQVKDGITGLSDFWIRNPDEITKMRSTSMSWLKLATESIERVENLASNYGYDSKSLKQSRLDSLEAKRAELFR